MRSPFVSRRTSGDRVPGTDDVPGWVSRFRRWGVPAAAVLVLVLCAPGEQHLADLSGWSYRLSWGMAGLFTLYAGLAAVISTQLPTGARGKLSSVWGAVLSLGLAMGAQPVSHLFVTGYLTAEPRPPLWLVSVVSSVPPLILGHLLHFAAMPAKRTAAVPVSVPRPKRTSPVPAPAGTAPVPVSLSKKDKPSRARTDLLSPVPVDELSQLRSLTEVVRALRTAGHGRDTIKDIVLTVPGYEDTKPNTLNRALARTA